MSDLFTALGLVLVIEGVLYALAPASMKAAMLQMLTVQDGQLRRGGIVALLIGFCIVWFVRN